jgi:hypothetical protein
MGIQSGRDVEGARPAARIAGLAEPGQGAARALEGDLGFVESRLGSQELGIHRMLGLVVGEGAGEGESPRFRPHVAAAREIEVDHVGAAEARITLEARRRDDDR